MKFTKMFRLAAGMTLLAAVVLPAAAQAEIGGTPLVVSGCTVDLHYTTNASCTAVTVPAGMRLVVQTAAVQCDASAISSFPPPPDFMEVRLSRGWAGSANVVYGAAVPIRKHASGILGLTPDAMWSGVLNGPLYADSKLNLEVLRFPGSVNDAKCRVTIDGYLMTIPQ